MLAAIRGMIRMERRTLSASEKLELLQAIRHHLRLSPEEYRLLVLNVLREHRNAHVQRVAESVERAA